MKTISISVSVSATTSVMDKARRAMGDVDGRLYSVVIRKNGKATFIPVNEVKDEYNEVACDLTFGQASALKMLINEYGESDGKNRYGSLRAEWNKEHKTKETIISDDAQMVADAKRKAQDARNLRIFAESKAEEKRKQIEELRRKLAEKKRAEEEAARKAEEERKAREAAERRAKEEAERKAKREAEIKERDRQIAEYNKKRAEEEAYRADVLKHNAELDDEIAKLMAELGE